MKSQPKKIKNMKRKLFYIVVLALFGLSYASAQNCNFDLVKTDPFTGETELRINTRYNNYFSMGLYRKGETYRIESYVAGTVCQSYFPQIGSLLDLKLGNGNTMTLTSVDNTESDIAENYDGYSLSYAITKDQFQEIADFGIQYVRTHFLAGDIYYGYESKDTYYDYEMKKSETEKVKSNASCILNYQPGTTADKKAGIPSGYFAMNYGMGVPVGGFADKTGTGYGGYAKPGYDMDYAFGIPINHSNFGIALKAGMFLNSFDNNSYVSTLQASDPTKTYQAVIGGHDYMGVSFMGGLFTTIPVNNFSFDFKAMGGIAFCHMPTIDYQTTDNASTSFFPETSDYNYTTTASSAFAYDIGVDFRINPKNKYVQVNPWRKVRTMGFIFGVDYSSAKPTANTTLNTGYASTSTTSTTESVTISMLTFSVGFEYSF